MGLPGAASRLVATLCGTGFNNSVPGLGDQLRAVVRVSVKAFLDKDLLKSPAVVVSSAGRPAD